MPYRRSGAYVPRAPAHKQPSPHQARSLGIPSDVVPTSGQLVMELYQPSPLFKMIGEFTKVHYDLSTQTLEWSEYLPRQARRFKWMKNSIKAIVRNRIDLRNWDSVPVPSELTGPPGRTHRRGGRSRVPKLLALYLKELSGLRSTPENYAGGKDMEDSNEHIQCVTCTKCGWVHVAYTREQAEACVKSFNDYFETLSVEKQNDYYGGTGSSLEKDYIGCNVCKNETFRPSKDGDCPDGCTIGPVIYEEKSDEAS